MSDANNIKLDIDLNLLNETFQIGFNLVNLSDSKIVEYYNGFKKAYSDFNEGNMAITSLEKRHKVYEFFALKGLEFYTILKKVINEYKGDNGYTYLQSEAPELALWILRIFDKTVLSLCESRLKSEGMVAILPRGWIWYWRSLAYYVMGNGEQMVYCMKQSDKEDIDHSGTHGMAYQRLQENKKQMRHKLVNASPNLTSTYIDENIIDALENLLPEIVFDIIGVSYGLTNFSNYQNIDGLRDERNLRFLFTLTESVCRKLLNIHLDTCTEHNRTTHPHMYNIANIGTLLQLNSLISNVYTGYPQPSTLWDKDLDAKGQLKKLNLQMNEITSDINPHHFIHVIKNARNLFLHNFDYSLEEELEKLLDLSTITVEGWKRSLLRITWEYLGFLIKLLENPCTTI